MTGLKQDVSELRQDVTVLQQNVTDIKVDLQCLHADDHMILDEIVRVHGFLENHINDAQKHTA